MHRYNHTWGYFLFHCLRIWQCRPVPRLGFTVLQLAIRSGAGQLVKRLLAEDAFDISAIDKANVSNGNLTLLHEAVQSDSEDVLDAILGAPCAKDFASQAIDISVYDHCFTGVTPVINLALIPVFCPQLATAAADCNRRAVMLGKLLRSLDSFGIDCGPHIFQLKSGTSGMSAVAVAALLCHALPMQMVLSVRTEAAPPRHRLFHSTSVVLFPRL